MSDIGTEYGKLVESFLAHAIAVGEMRDFFIDKFRRETRPLDEVLSLVLEGFVSDLETYTADPELLAGKPKLYLSEDQIRERARTLLRHLAALGRT